MVLLGIGLGPSIPLFTLAIQTAVPMQQIGVATAAATFFRQMGTTIGIAIIGTIFASSLATAMQNEHAEARASCRRSWPRHGRRAAAAVKARRSRRSSRPTSRSKRTQGIDAAPMPAAAKVAAKERAHAAIDKVDPASSSRSPTR